MEYLIVTISNFNNFINIDVDLSQPETFISLCVLGITTGLDKKDESSPKDEAKKPSVENNKNDDDQFSMDI